jgi:hypothetical protein
MKTATKYETIREIFEVVSFGIVPSKLLPGADSRGYVRGATPPSIREIALVRQWLHANARRTKTIRRGHDSYGLRSDIVAWYAEMGDEVYISNGAVIAACLAEGFRAVRTRRDAPNAYFDLAVRK